MNIAVIGCGYWGTHIVRNFNSSEKWHLKTVCDLNPKQLEKARLFYPYINITEDYHKILEDPEITAVAIATPVHTHYAIVKDALEAGKDVWIEKPLTSDSSQAAELVELARKKGLLLHIDHTFIYTPAVRKIKEIVQSGELGEIFYFDSVRINLGLFQHDINVIWDLAPHDVSIFQYAIGKKPVSVNANGRCHINYAEHPHENIAYVTVNFEDSTIAHFHVNWLSPVKIRQIIIGGSRKMLVFNDMAQADKLKIYDCGVNIRSREEVYKALIQYRVGDMHSPAIENEEALIIECDHFFECVKFRKMTDTPGEAGLYVVKILEAANRSLANKGALIEL